MSASQQLIQRQQEAAQELLLGVKSPMDALCRNPRKLNNFAEWLLAPDAGVEYSFVFPVVRLCWALGRYLEYRCGMILEDLSGNYTGNYTGFESAADLQNMMEKNLKVQVLRSIHNAVQSIKELMTQGKLGSIDFRGFDTRGHLDMNIVLRHHEVCVASSQCTGEYGCLIV